MNGGEFSKDGKLVYTSHAVHSEDDANILKLAEKDKDILTYSGAHTAVDRFKVWDEMYGKEWTDDPVFNVDSRAYNVGVPPLRKRDLRDFTPDDNIVNRFEEILRHNNVSDKENAFNRLTALFICKLVDESTKQGSEETDFQYKQGTDTYETLQDRLQRLHSQGMKEFMREDIVYIPSDYAENLFSRLSQSKRREAVNELNATIRKLKFYSNNDFAFKDVHNEELFLQNGKILVEVVQLFQNYRIVYQSRHQFLGDLFEQLLNKGFKQNEGQFFTPMPVTRFVWDALPVADYISRIGQPKVIDYACGAGHFLTEAVEAINDATRRNDAADRPADNTWTEKYIFGVEKDYRLARVSKISMFMNGAGGANIIFGDGLENYPDKGIAAGAFDILVANPPYSVKAFKQHLKLKNNTFELLSKISDDSGEIEALFVERITQLLRPQGLAAVILPVSILTNNSTCYTAAREKLLENFLLRAIAVFGSKTFGATGTNTVMLFLERFNEPPCKANLMRDSVDAAFDIDAQKDFPEDGNMLRIFLEDREVSLEDYQHFLRKEASPDYWERHNYFKIYTDAFNRQPIKYPRNATDEEKGAIRKDKFYKFAIDIERDKLYYFSLAYTQNTLVVTAPTSVKEQTDYLGYSWSERRGNEGIIINPLGGKLYNINDRLAEGTIAHAVRNTFANAITEIDNRLQQYIKYFPLKDLINFDTETFNKEIATTAKKEIKFESKYSLTELHNVINIIRGVTYSKAQQSLAQTPLAILPADNVTMDGHLQIKKVIYLNNGISLDENKRLCKGDCFMCFSSGSKNQVGKTCYIDDDIQYYAGGFMGILRPKENMINPKYLYYVLNHSKYRQIISEESTGANINNLSSSIGNIQIPYPPDEVQQQIVNECEAIDEEYNKCNEKIEVYQKSINTLIDNSSATSGNVFKLKDLCEVKGGKRIPKGMGFSKEPTEHPYIRVTDFTHGTVDMTDIKYIGDAVYNLISRYTISIDDIYLSIAGTIGVVGMIPSELNGANLTENAAKLVIKDNSAVNAKYLMYALNTPSAQEQIAVFTHALGVPKLALDRIKEIKVYIPSIEAQREAVREIDIYEQEISKAQAIMNSCADRIQAVLDKYLRPTQE